jgi:TLC ATP/ADP transporter
MGLIDQWISRGGWGQRLLRWVNLRSEEAERTFFMFAFYAVTSIGLVWLEAITADLFLSTYKAEGLPWVYIVSAGMGSGLSFVYSRLQRYLPLRRVIVIIAVLMALPLMLFWLGLGSPASFMFPGWQVSVVGITIFLMRLWVEAINVLNELNTAITANQLFNIREIKRTYPLISSGILLADVISGFSLGFLIHLVGLQNMVMLSFVMMAIGAAILFYLSQTYQQSFPDFLRRRADAEERRSDFSTNRPVKGPVQRYVVLLFVFFILAQVLFLLIDFRFLSELEQQYATGDSEGKIAAFLGFFNGILGIFEVSVQWLVSSRLIERAGVFQAALLLPIVILIFGVISSLISIKGASVVLFLSLLTLKFLDELLHYTLFASMGPVLFQPIPDSLRSGIQAVVRGIAEPLATGATGLALLGLVWLSKNTPIGTDGLSWLFLAIVILALVWILDILRLRAKYVNLLVMSAERGQLSRDVDEMELRRWVVETLDKPGREDRKESCIDLLSKVDPKSAGDVLSAHLMDFSPKLQRQSLEAMLLYPNPTYLLQVRSLIEQSPLPEVLAVALRFVWLTEEDPDIRQLRPYLRSEVDPVVRGTAASLMMRRGNPTQKAEATNTLRQMLTHKQERERVMGCRALGEAAYLQALRIYIPNLLKDESLRVRRAILEAIAATHFEEFYPSLLRGLHYKSTREAAMKALVRLDNEAIQMLVKLAEDGQQPDGVRMYAWQTVGLIGTLEALDALIAHLMVAWGTERRNILRILLEMPGEVGIETVLNRLGRSGVEALIDQELMFIGQIYAALMDLEADKVRYREGELLRRAIRGIQGDAQERLFLLMQFLYPIGAIKAAAFNLQSASRSNMARGLEILDNTLDIPSKRALINLLDRNSDLEKLRSLSEIVSYEPLSPSDRLRRLLDFRHFLSDWATACCFHLAKQARWSLTPEQTLACLRHPKGFVREAVLAYLWMASPRAMKTLLPLLQKDPDRLVVDQVKTMLDDLDRRALNSAKPSLQNPSIRPVNLPSRPGFETI